MRNGVEVGAEVGAEVGTEVNECEEILRDAGGGEIQICVWPFKCMLALGVNEDGPRVSTFRRPDRRG